MVAVATTGRTNPTTANLARIDEWLDRLAGEVDAAAHSEEITRYLQSLARFWTYSARNAWLITIQMPEAQRVASRKTWKSLGRSIKGDQWRRGLEILCPHFRKAKDVETGEERDVLTHFTTGWVFDISQTEGQPLPQPRASRARSVRWLPSSKVSSTPAMGRTPCAWQARAWRTRPASESWSVSASAW